MIQSTLRELFWCESSTDHSCVLKIHIASNEMIQSTPHELFWCEASNYHFSLLKTHIDHKREQSAVILYSPISQHLCNWVCHIFLVFFCFFQLPSELPCNEFLLWLEMCEWSYILCIYAWCQNAWFCCACTCNLQLMFCSHTFHICPHSLFWPFSNFHFQCLFVVCLWTHAVSTHCWERDSNNSFAQRLLFWCRLNFSGPSLQITESEIRKFSDFFNFVWILSLPAIFIYLCPNSSEQGNKGQYKLVYILSGGDTSTR